MTRVALIAHDDEKPEMLDFADAHREYLATIDIVTTGTTGTRIQAETGLDVERKASGPMGGDLQIGAEVVDKRLDGIVFLRDPLTAQPHEPDISALLRICDVHDTPLATTRSGAEYLLAGIAAEDGVELER
ncbi:methylglyoxal synthase [Haloarchaeobius iranensis]|uniref:Methylglyoxal synthase n=1 Tax=Haloarchaeobius iranensis TaxID=996166 RepID=A0A1G9UVJ4_9EURY|nr:methylglyoxal synthase [Haloarchaeobius iranensis]SDM63829.1 methylglyoxal synthase [Haloarchaeobius iranensis]